MDVGEKQRLTVEFDSVRNTDESYMTARACGTNRLRHRLLSADAFQHGVSPDSAGQLFDAGHTLVTPLVHDVGSAKLESEFLPRFVAAHHDDPLCAHLSCREHTEQPDRAVTNDRNCRARLHVGCI